MAAHRRTLDTKIIETTKNDVDETKAEIQPKKDNTSLVVFIGLLLDLLGENISSKIIFLNPPFPAFTLILPLFPALLAHYRDNDDSGLFKLLEDKVRIYQNYNDIYCSI